MSGWASEIEEEKSPTFPGRTDIEDRQLPLIGVGGQVGAVLVEVCEAELAVSAVDPPAHLTPDFAKTRPTESQLWQRPAHERDAGGVLHSEQNTASPRTGFSFA